MEVLLEDNGLNDFIDNDIPKPTTSNTQDLADIRGIFRSKMGLLRKMYNQNKLYKNQ